MSAAEEPEFAITLDHAARIVGIPSDATGGVADILRAKFGRPLSEACSLRDVQRIDAVLRAILMGKSAAPAQAELAAATGTVRECTFRFTPLHGANERIQGVIVHVSSETPQRGTLGTLPAALLSRLMGLAKSLNLAGDAPTIAAAVARGAKLLTRADVAVVFLLDRFTGLLRPVAHLGLPEPLHHISINHGEGTVGRVFATGRETWEAKLTEAVAPDDPARTIGAQSYIHIPLSHEASAAGVLSVYALAEDHFDDSDVRVLTGLAEIASAGLHRAMERHDQSRSEASVALVLQEAPLGIVAFDTEGRITHINPEFLRLARLEAAQPRAMLGRNIFAQSIILQNRLSQTLVALLRGEPFRQEIERLNAGETAFACEMHGRALRNEAGAVIGAVVLARDIERRAEAVRALRDSEERYRSLFENSRDALIILTPEGTITDVNPAAAEMLGVDRERLAGKSGRDLAPRDDAGRAYRDALDRLRRDGRLLRSEVRLSRGADADADAEFPAEINGVRLGDGTILVSARDTTDRAELESRVVQAQKMEAIGTLAGGIAHDFNNLLGGIMGYASLLHEEMRLRPETSLAIDSILSATRAAKERTAQLLAFARGGKYQVRPVNLNELLTNLRDVVTHSLGPRIRVDLELPVSPITVMGDGGQLSGAFMNLIINAKDAVGAEGRITISLKMRHFLENYQDADWTIDAGRYAMVQVEDTGSGIVPEVMDKIFEPYFTTKGTERATGLGLSVVIGVVENHGGSVAVDSRVGEGTRFRVYLPHDGFVPEQAPLPLKPIVRPRDEGKRRILVAEDEPMLRTLAENVLQKSGYEVFVAEDGQEAVEIFKREKGRFDLVLLDMVMPRMSGDAAFALMREQRPDVTVLLSSGYSKDTVAQDLFAGGAAGFLEKPYDITQLLDAIRQILDG
ncbi:MAG: PAS domain-containing protein [Deltaproteobacteria bacterium]|nr:PAS domain-containing protein [Deltaproteobacteria bacterium]